MKWSRLGFEGRLDYSAIGSVCNLAARPCGEARGGQILIPHRIATLMEELVDVEAVGELPPKGFQRQVPTYNILGLRQRKPARKPLPPRA